MGLENLRCYRCEEYGHLAASCHELNPATTRAEHEARLARYVERWMSGEWTPDQKRKAISEENRMWHGDKCTPMHTYPRSNS